jgi:WD40 repeat protein
LAFIGISVQLVAAQDIPSTQVLDLSNVKSLQAVLTIEDFAYRDINHLTFCVDSSHLCFSEENTIYIWHIFNQTIQEISLGESVIGIVPVDQDSLVAATESFLGSWNMQTGELEGNWILPAPITTIAMNRSRTKIVCGHPRSFLTIWEYPPYVGSHFWHFEGIVYGDGPRTLATAINDSSEVIAGNGIDIEEWNLKTRQEEFISDDTVTDIEFDATGRYAAIALEVKLPTVWDTVNNSSIDFEIPDQLASMHPTIRNLAFQPEGKFFIAVGDKDPFFSVWDITSHQAFLFSGVYAKTPTDIVFSPDGRLIAIKYTDGVIQILGVPSSRQ